jgi:formylglycine-generating enzyme required for sulfatase activity
MREGRQSGVAKVLMADGPVLDPRTGREVGNAGMGILVDSRYVITCAHVVNTALRLSEDAAVQPDRKVPIVLPFLESERPVPGKVIVWRPMGAKPIGDIAVLELDEDAPAEAGIARFASSELVSDDDKLKVYGYRAGGDEGNSIDAKFMGETGPGRAQIDGTNLIGFFIEGGYSGAAVWDTDQGAVVGMVTARSVDRADRVAYMVPVSALEKIWPTLLVRKPPRRDLGETAEGLVPGWPDLFVREVAGALERCPRLANEGVLDAIIEYLPVGVRSAVEQNAGLDLLLRLERVVHACAIEGQVPRLVGLVQAKDDGSGEVQQVVDILREIRSGVIFLPSLRERALNCLARLPLDDAELHRLAKPLDPDPTGQGPAGREQLLKKLAHLSPREEPGMPPALEWLERVALRIENRFPYESGSLRELDEELWAALDRSADSFGALIDRLRAKAAATDEMSGDRSFSIDPDPEEFEAVALDPLPIPPGVLFVPWDDQSQPGRRVDEIIHPWLASIDPQIKPLVLVPHFPADATDTLLAVEAICRASRTAQGRAREVRRVSGSGWTGLRAALDRIRVGRKSIVFLLDLSNLSLDVPITEAAGWRDDLSRFCGTVGPGGHRVVVVHHRALLALREAYRALDDAGNLAHVAAELFNPEYEIRQSLGKDDGIWSLFPDSGLGMILEGLLRVNSTALPRALVAAVGGQRDPFDTDDEFPVWSLLRVAGRLAREGFLEPAYRLELYCRSRRQFLESIRLGGDLFPLRDDHPPVVGLVDPLEDLPGLMPRSILSGPAGSGRTLSLLRMAHVWALPRGSLQGIAHPSWLPVQLQYAETASDPADSIRAEFSDQGRFTQEIPFRSENLKAHSQLSRLATPENLPWLVSSSVLFLVDGVRAHHTQAGDWLEALHRRSAPETGLVVAWDLEREPRSQNWVAKVMGRGVRARIRPLEEDQIRGLASGGCDAEKLCSLLALVDKPVAGAIRNPYLCGLVGKSLERGESVENWSLHDILAADVRQRVGSSPALEIAELIGNWLPAVALAQREGNLIPNDPVRLDLARDLGLVGPGSGLRFVDTMLRDYFAAAAIAKEADRVSPAPTFVPFLDRVQDRSQDGWIAEWETPLRIVAGGRPRLRELLIRELAARDLRLTLRCAREIPSADALTLIGKAAEQLADRVRSRRVRSASGGYDLVQAAADAVALGSFDPRIRPETPRTNLADGEIPAPAPFRIGRFPVTNLEFGRFLNAGGYERPDYWMDTSWEWLQTESIRWPRYWRNPTFNRPNAPVVGVSLHEVEAYCRWLGADGPGSEDRPAGRWHLPSPEQWDRALGLADTLLLGVLRAQQSRRPDGPPVSDAALNRRLLADVTVQLDHLLEANSELLDSELLDRLEADTCGTLPVGLFPPNEFDCHDLIGRVWEWCVYEPGEKGDLSEPKPVKGGPLRSHLAAVWTIFGGFFDPRTRFHQIGFRVCFTPAPTE